MVFSRIQLLPLPGQNIILEDNYHSNTNPWVGLNVNREMNVHLGTNIQWPQYRPNGSEDTKATGASIFASADLDHLLVYQGGPTPTLSLDGAGPAMGTGTGCPTTDQRLAIRSVNCDLGAFEFGATTWPDHVQVQGYQLGQKHFVANSTIQSDAILLSDAKFTFNADGEVDPASRI